MNGSSCLLTQNSQSVYTDPSNPVQISSLESILQSTEGALRTLLERKCERPMDMQDKSVPQRVPPNRKKAAYKTGLRSASKGPSGVEEPLLQVPGAGAAWSLSQVVRKSTNTKHTAQRRRAPKERKPHVGDGKAVIEQGNGTREDANTPLRIPQKGNRCPDDNKQTRFWYLT